MNHLDDVRRARSSLAWLFEPNDPQLRDFVATHGPVEVFDRLRDGRLPATGLREEVRRVRAEQLWQEAASAVNPAQRDGVRILIPEDADWPAGLADLATPPGGDGEAALCLWVRGSLPAAATLHRSVTVTGARAATAYGTHVATELSYDLASHGWTVLAAGAYGIDAAAHRGALTGEGTTVAALPGGLERPFPTGNAALFDRIADQGLLLSAWPPGATPSRTRIVANQRLLAALSRGVVVVEAALRSGALNTLRQAITLGRPAMVVPGPVTSTTSAGCHQALCEHPQVRLVTGIADVLDELEQ